MEGQRPQLFLNTENTCPEFLLFVQDFQDMWTDILLNSLTLTSFELSPEFSSPDSRQGIIWPQKTL